MNGVDESTSAAGSGVEPWYPAWAPWILWPLVLAVGVVVFTEPVKWALYKAKRAPFRKAWARQKSHYAKAQLLMPFKTLLGAFGGFFLFREAEMLPSGLLTAALGAAVGAFSSTLYDSAMRTTRFLPEIIKGRLTVASSDSSAGAEDDGGYEPGDGPSGGRP